MSISTSAWVGQGLTLRHIRYFVAIAEEGSIARAAARLRVAQPALSRQVHDLEAHVGESLFHRHAHGVDLTAPGAALVPVARDILSALDHAADETHRANIGAAGEVRVALSPYAVESPRVSRMLAALRDAFPGVMLEIHQLQSEAQATALRAGDIDIGIGIGGSEAPELVRSEELFIDPVSCAILPSTHPLANRTTVTAAELRDFPLIHFPRSVSRIFPQILIGLEQSGLQVARECETVSAVHWHVAAGKGWALGLASQVGRAPTGTVAIPFSDFRVSTPMVARVRPTDRSHMIERLVEALVAVAKPGAPSLNPEPRRPSTKLAHAVEKRHFEALIAVCEERSLSRGAERLGLTQSGASRRIAALEGLLDTKLLEHAGATVIPTIACRALVRHARKVVDLCEVTLPAAVAGTGRCRLGMVPTRANESAVVHVIRRLGSETFDVTEMLSANVEGALLDGRIDVGVSHALDGVTDAAIETMALTDDAIECALLPANHRLAAEPRIAASDLSDEPFLFLPRSNTPLIYDRILDALERAGFRPTVHATANTARSLRGMVAASLGWTVAFRSQHEQRESPDLVAVPIEGLYIAAGMQLLWRRDERNRRTLGVVRAFREWKLGAASG